MKNEICTRLEFKTVLIRLKEKFGFNFDNPHIFQSEIIRQFQIETGINISPIPILVFDNSTNNLLIKKN